MEKYIYRPVRFYLITFACTWFWWLFAILLNEGTGLYLGMFLGLVSPAVVIWRQYKSVFIYRRLFIFYR